TIWPIRRFNQLGLDVGLSILPYHGHRRGQRWETPRFPSQDPRLTIEGFRQAVADVRALARWFTDRGAPYVGVLGASLGGAVAALTATVCRDLDFMALMIPLASIADFARDQGRLGSGPAAEVEHAAAERATAVVSPLARPLRLPRSRALVIAAASD